MNMNDDEYREWLFAEDENAVNGFFGNYRFLSNFHPSEIQYQGCIYPTSEHAYQAAKAKNVIDREMIRNASTPALAKRLGGRAALREDWGEVKLSIMGEILREKFQIIELRDLLLKTFPKTLSEGNWWGDTFWGVYKGKGENNLGKLLMQIRNEHIILRSLN